MVDELSLYLPFWDKLTAAEQRQLQERSVLQRYKKGTILHRGGNDCLGVLQVKSGRLRTYLLSAEGREITLFHVLPGEICLLSASCILNHITFDVFISVEEDTEVIRIPADSMAQISDTNVYAENFLYKMTAQRFSDVMQALQQVLFMGFDQRLATFLLEESARSGRPVIHMTHEQIAREVGGAREVVSRTARQFAEAGWISLARGSITLLDEEGLRSQLD